MDIHTTPIKSEARGALALKNEVAKFDKLSDDIPTGYDNRPIWDGHIWVYNSNQQSVANLFGRIPVQVKGESVSKFSIDHRTFPIAPAHLLGYESESGTMVFVVETHKRTLKSRIFYASLLPYDIAKLFEDVCNRGTDANISLKLKQYKPTRATNLDILCRNFLRERRIQRGKVPVSLDSLTGIKSFEFSVTANKGKIFDYLLENPGFVFAVDENNTKHLIDKFEATNIKSSYNAQISIGDRIYFSRITEEYEGGGKKSIRIGNNLLVSRTSVHFEIKPGDNVADQINGIEFFIDALNNKGFDIDGKKFGFDVDYSDESKDVLDKFKKQLDGLYNLKAALNFLGITNLGQLSSYHNNDLLFLKYIIDTKINHKKAQCPFDLENGFMAFPIADKRIQLLYLNGKLWNVFSREFISEIPFTIKGIDGTVETISPYCNDNPTALIKSYNFNPEIVMESIQQNPITKMTEGRYTNLLLATLLEYDKNSSRNDLLNFADQLSSLILNHVADEASQLNRFQVIRRQRLLNYGETETIYDIIKRTNDLPILCGAHILLGNEQEYRSILSQMNEQARDAFCAFPIHNLTKMVFLS